jgi:hypothetical protein
MDPLIKRGDKTPAFPDPAGAITPAEHDANLQTIEDAVNALETGKLDVDAAEVVTATKPSPVDADQLLMFDSAAAGAPVLVTKAQLLAGVGSGGGATAPLAVWDFWQSENFSNNTGVSVAFNQFAGGGSITTAPPAASFLGYNPGGLFVRSGTGTPSTYRIQQAAFTIFFGQLAYKWRMQFMPLTSHVGRTIRAGFHSAAAAADAAHGVYFEILAGVCSAKAAAGSTRTTHATTQALTLGVPYTFEIDVNAAGTEARYRVWEGTTSAAVMDVTITTNIPTLSTQLSAASASFIEDSAAASDVGVLYSMGYGTAAGYSRARA